VIEYEKYPLLRIADVQEIVSADYMIGLHPAYYHHAHQDAWELCCCVEGEAVVFKDGRQIPISKGEVVLIQPGVRHNTLVERKDTVTFIISFTCVCRHLRSLQDSIIVADEELLSLFRKMRRELERSFRQETPTLHLYHFTPSGDAALGAEQMICCYLEQAIILMLRSVTMKSGSIVRTAHLQEALQHYLSEQVHSYIREHLHQPLRAEDLAAHFHYSRGRLSAIMKAVTGMSLGSLITYERIQAAKRLLVEGDLTVQQVAESLCYPSAQYFSYRFSREVGCPPSQYAQSVREGKEE